MSNNVLENRGRVVENFTQYWKGRNTLDVLAGPYSLIEETPEENDRDRDHETKENSQCKCDGGIRKCFAQVFGEFNI